MEKYIILQGFYDCYAVSDLGNIMNIRNGFILKQRTDKYGYKDVLLSKNGKKMRIRVHRLVANAFLDNPNNKPDVNHKNGIKSDNRAENLEWCTESENMQHAFDNGLFFNSKYTNKNIIVRDSETNNLLFIFESVKQCCNYLNLNTSPVYRVLKGKTKKHKNMIFQYEDRI